MDPLVFAGWAQAAAGFAGAGAVVYAAHRGAATVQDWLAQRSAERQVLAAERVLTLAHRLRRDFDRIRDPFQLAGEQSEAEVLLKQTESDFRSHNENHQRRRVASQVVLTRLLKRGDIWEELFACLPLARAYFGEGVENALFEFWKARHRILHAAMMLAEEGLTTSDRREYEGDIWSRFNEARGKRDPVTETIEGSSKALEEALLPILRASAVRSTTRSPKGRG
jgi:hypothetical protein